MSALLWAATVQSLESPEQDARPGADYARLRRAFAATVAQQRGQIIDQPDGPLVAVFDEPLRAIVAGAALARAYADRPRHIEATPPPRIAVVPRNDSPDRQTAAIAEARALAKSADSGDVIVAASIVDRLDAGLPFTFGKISGSNTDDQSLPAYRLVGDRTQGVFGYKPWSSARRRRLGLAIAGVLIAILIIGLMLSD